jgi:hypothetical protein
MDLILVNHSTIRSFAALQDDKGRDFSKANAFKFYSV